MLNIMNQSELKKFIKKYFNIYDSFAKSIKKVSYVKYDNVVEYLINDSFIIRMYE